MLDEDMLPLKCTALTLVRDHIYFKGKKIHVMT